MRTCGQALRYLRLENKGGNYKITRDRNNQKLASASGQTTANSLTQAINKARDRGDIELLERIAKDPQAFILKQGWASVSLDAARGLMA